MMSTLPPEEPGHDASELSMKERIKLFSQADGENDLVRFTRNSSHARKKEILNNGVGKVFKILEESGKSEEAITELKLAQQKLAELDAKMSKLTSELGSEAFFNEDFATLLEERDDCLEILKKAGITPETISKAKTKSKSMARGRNPRQPRRKSHRVSATRLKELNTKYEPKEFAKSEDDKAIIQAELKRNFIFKKVQDAALNDMLKAFEPIDHYKKGDVIIEQYDVGDFFYILGKGSVAYEVNGENVGHADKPGTSFGELALLYQSPRKATVRADSDDMRVYRVDHVTFRYILQSRSKFKALAMQAVTKIKAVNRLLALVDLTASSHHRQRAAGGDDDSSTSAMSEFEEIGEARHDPDDPTKDYFELSERRKSIRSSLSQSSVSVESFRRNSLLGEGQFGEVWLVEPEDIEEIDEAQFALKIQSKEDMNRASVEYSVQDAIKRECDVLSSMVHPFIVDYVRSFEDEENIYMVMGAIRGKELWDFIHREVEDGEWVSGIPEEHARFYAVLIADTLNYMHRQRVCHRDVKPENVMINEHGYPVLVDFGFAKMIPNDRTYTLCGTPKYTAPEIITNQGHGCAVDHWALGVVIYEMLSGENPFWHDEITDLQLLEDICNATPYPIDDEVECGEDARDLVMKLLEKDPIERLVGKDVTSHPWFDGIDFRKARKMQLTTPGPLQ